MVSISERLKRGIHNISDLSSDMGHVTCVICIDRSSCVPHATSIHKQQRTCGTHIETLSCPPSRPNIPPWATPSNYSHSCWDKGSKHTACAGSSVVWILTTSHQRVQREAIWRSKVLVETWCRSQKETSDYTSQVHIYSTEASYRVHGYRCRSGLMLPRLQGRAAMICDAPRLI